MVVGHDENYEAKLSGNARAGIGGVAMKIVTVTDWFILMQIILIASRINQPIKLGRLH